MQETCEIKTLGNYLQQIKCSKLIVGLAGQCYPVLKSPFGVIWLIYEGGEPDLHREEHLRNKINIV